MTTPDGAPPPLLVFTDLDGTLLDHETYDWSPAADALTALAEAGAVVIPATSKTRAEVAPLMEALGLSGPAIVENGAGLIGPGAPEPCIDDIRARLNDLPTELRRAFQGFGDWTAEEVAKRTGLPLEDAERAHAREFSEPGVWLGDDEMLEGFESALALSGLTIRRGGRFIHVLPGADKAARMAEIRAGFAPCPAMALGDAPNDAEMLAAADIGVIIPNPSGPAPFPEGEAPGHVRTAAAPGPEGWAAETLATLEEIRGKG
ncbi:HAD-IIB family hydrolase [Rhodovulum sp. DZ06]|uniref:HAD-IIB family hydrolase n=1 Tax=Rhodovulum sp. DZ06 TaxID=3425126 RepID=UPI003D336D1F